MKSSQKQTQQLALFRQALQHTDIIVNVRKVNKAGYVRISKQAKQAEGETS